MLACVALSSGVVHGGSPLSSVQGLKKAYDLSLSLETLVSFLVDFLYLLLCGSGERGPFGCIT